MTSPLDVNTENSFESDPDSYVVVSSSNEASDEESDIFPTLPPSAPMADDTPVRLRPTQSSSSRLSSPNPLAIRASPSPSASASYQELANRPRSNPRNRTPMRKISSVPMGTLNRSTIVNHEDDQVNSSTTVAGNAFTPTTIPSSRVQPGVGLPVGSIVRGKQLEGFLHERFNVRGNNAVHNPSRSNKQGPSHRKLRRWNNDNFFGIASEISNANPTARGALISKIYAEAEMEKSAYLFPNYPLENNSCLTTLLGSGSEVEDYEKQHIATVRERFLNGEVCDKNRNLISERARDRLLKREEEIFNDGRKMVEEKLQSRLLNVVTRACQSSVFSRNILSAFERVLVKHLSFNDVSVCDDKQDNDESILEKVLMQKPLLTRKSSNETKNSTIRFLFDNESDQGAFSRLLLHGACQFHGLNTSSVTTSSGRRLLTVTGICKGNQFRLIDFLDFTKERNNIFTSKSSSLRNVTPGSNPSASIIEQHMSTLKVS